MDHNQLVLLLECYRNDLELSISAIVNYNGFNICSINTYRRLVARENIRDKDQLLIDLFNGIDRQLTDFDDTDLYDDLYEAITTYDSGLIVNECDKILTKIDHIKDYAYYDKVFESINVIKEYYLNKTYSSEEFYWHYVKYEKVINTKLNDIMYIMFVYSYAKGIYNKGSNWLSMLGDKSKHLVFLNSEITFYLDHKKSYKALLIITELDKLIKPEDSIIYLKYLSNRIIVLDSINEEYSEELATILQMIKISSIHNYQKYIICANVGYVILKERRYSDFISLFDNLTIPSSLIVRHEMLINFALSQLGSTKRNLTVTKEVLNDSVEITARLYEYLANIDTSYDNKNKELLNIYKLLDEGAVVYRYIIREEIIKNCEFAKSYKALYIIEKLNLKKRR